MNINFSLISIISSILFIRNSLIMAHRLTTVNSTFLHINNYGNNFIKNYSVFHGSDNITLTDVIRILDQNHTIFLDGYNSSLHHHHHSKVGLNIIDEKTPLFPIDLFSIQQRRHGAVILHILGVIYMFVALAIVCDEFFVPSLDVIIEKLDIADDVAGATFMAAGGSAPELFTSIIGVFVSFDDVGIGTIVGSAVFNILFVIGMCAICSKTILTLTWWPLFRDCTFYSVSLITLIYFFKDNYIYWYEALVLFGFYLIYVSFMKWNRPMEKLVKRALYRDKVIRVRSTDQLMPTHQNAVEVLHQPYTTNNNENCLGNLAQHQSNNLGSLNLQESSSRNKDSRFNSVMQRKTTNNLEIIEFRKSQAKFRHGLLQLMIHTIDPLHDGKIDEKAAQLHAIASLKVLLDATKTSNGKSNCMAANQSNTDTNEFTFNLQDPIDCTTSAIIETTTCVEQIINGRISVGQDAIIELGDEEDEQEPLDMTWPNSSRKRITYVLVAPILFPLWLTLPDTRTSKGRKFFAITFIGSIFWIAAYSYLMVWWANIAGDTVQIPPEVMGLTFLAAGTSIPDLITSVIVARKGFGDMAVSSSVGSNIFDVTVGAGKPPIGLHLDVLKGEKLIQKLMVDEKRCYLFGRNQQLNDFCIDHASCSRVHAALVYHKHLNRTFLVDLGSTHGTYIGSMRLESQKPTQLPIDSAFHFGASTRYYVIRERPQTGTRPIIDELEKINEDQDTGGLLGLPETEIELDNLTEFNTAHNRRISMLGITDDEIHKVTRKRKKKGITFNDDEEIINPEDVDPSVGRFRNLIQTTVVPSKRMRMEGGLISLSEETNNSFKHMQPASIVQPLYHNLPPEQLSFSTSQNVFSIALTSLTSRLGIGLPNPAPEVEMISNQVQVESVNTTEMYSSVEAHSMEPKKKKYAKEAWPGKKPMPTLLV